MELSKRHSWIETKYIKVLHKGTRFPIDFLIPTDVERPFYIDILYRSRAAAYFFISFLPNNVLV